MCYLSSHHLCISQGLEWVLGGLFLGLSYLHIIHVNLDLTPVKEGVQQSEGWLADQAGRLKEVVLDALPSTGAGVLGFFVGFKR